MNYEVLFANLEKYWKHITGLLILLTFLNLIIFNFYQPTTQNTNQDLPIMKTYSVTGSSFFQSKGQKKWMYLSGEELISGGTEIRTGKNSVVVLSFLKQNGYVEISENSSLIISQDVEGPIIEFKDGEVFVNYQSTDINSPVFVRMGNNNFKILNSDLYLLRNGDSSVDVSVDYGKISLVSKGISNTFEKDQWLHFKDNENYSINVSKVKTVTPINYDRYNKEELRANVRFAYETELSVKGVQLYIGDSIGELKPKFSGYKSFKNNEFMVLLKPGSYYWRLGLKTNEKEGKEILSHVKKFFIEPKIPIQSTYPKEGERFFLQDAKNGILFQWDNPSKLEKSFIEISNRKDFKDVLENNLIKDVDYFKFKFDKAGTYYWRVNGFPFGASEILNGVVRSIRILDSLKEQKIVNLFPVQNTILSSVATEASEFQLKWKDNDQNSELSYEVEIKSQDNKTSYAYTTRFKEIKVGKLKPGKYKWSVKKKMKGYVSEESSFQIVETKEIYPKELSSGKNILIWNKGPSDTRRYKVVLLKIESNTDFNDLYRPLAKSKTDLYVKNEKFDLGYFPEGVYAIRIEALSKSDRMIADSKVQFVSLK